MILNQILHYKVQKVPDLSQLNLRCYICSRPDLVPQGLQLDYYPEPFCKLNLWLIEGLLEID